MSYDRLSSRLADGELILLDGGTGTELERRGVQMDPGAWSGAASADNVDVLEAIHCDYINAGADIITANTFASSRLMLGDAGAGHLVGDVNKAAVAAAHTAARRAGRGTLVAGSLSHMTPVIPGTDKTDPARAGTEVEMADAFLELATLHKAEGCDLIILEMMYLPRRVELALAAARTTGLPVWAGFSVRQGKNGDIVGFSPHEDVPFADLVRLLADQDVEAAGVMHSPSNLIGEAIGILKSGFAGPLMAYPDSGYFKMPNWQFDNIIPPAELSDYAKGWIAAGVGIVGGCCGMSPAHIAALNDLRS